LADLTKEHGHKLIPAAEAFRIALGIEPVNQLMKPLPVEQPQQLESCRRFGIRSFGRMAVAFQIDKSATASRESLSEGGKPWRRLLVS